MKLIILLSIVACSAAAKLDRTYLPPNAQASGGLDSFLQTPRDGAHAGFQSNYFNQNQQAAYYNAEGNNGGAYNSFEQRPERARTSLERNAAIVRQGNENDGERYAFTYETENGIYAEENGEASNGVNAQGGYSYVGDDGVQYSIRYTADQNGFQAQGDHLPTSPPIPEEILKALEQNARDEAAGIFDDGSYSENKYGVQNGYESNRVGLGNQGKYESQSDEDSVVINSAIEPRFDSRSRTSSSEVYGNSFRRLPQHRNAADLTTRAYLPPRNGY